MNKTKKLAGFPSIDKPWLKYYPEEAIHAKLEEVSAYEFIYSRNKTRLQKNALNYFGRTISFEEMFSNVNICANALKNHGAKKGDIISISLPNTPEAVYLFYAISKIGAVANMIDPRSSVENIADYINEVGSKLLFIVDVAAAKAAKVIDKTNIQEVITVSPADSLPAVLRLGYKLKNASKNEDFHYMRWTQFIGDGNESSHTENEIESNASEDPVLIVHTGGTTGTPKSVVLSNKSVNSIAFQSMLFPTDLQSKHKWLNIMPPFIAYGIGTGLHFPLAVGMEDILVPAFKPEEFDKLLLKYKPNHLSGVPSHWNNIINSKRLRNKDLSFLISCAVGGDTMDKNLEENSNRFLKEHGCKYQITKGYGMTEVNGSIGRTTNENNIIGSVGIPMVHSMVKICDPDTGEELSYNQHGEIYMSGPSVMIGYLNKEAETAAIKIKDANGTEWIRSGDIGYMDPDGNIFIVDRIKRMIVRHDGFKVFPSMIENVILKCITVKACCVIGAQDKSQSQGQLPLAYIVLHENNDDSNSAVLKELSALCNTELPEYAQPIAYRFVPALPLTPIGKVDYRALENM